VRNNIILVDVDDVIANLVDGWLSKYNYLSGDNLKSTDITEWDISKFVKPDWKVWIYELLENPKLYDSIKPIDGALDGINRLVAKGYRIVYVTSPVIETAGTKFRWLTEHRFPIRLENYVEARDKSLIFGHFMIDDGIHNIQTTLAGDALLFSKPWNEGYDNYTRVNNWQDITEWFGV
jgi:5'(3')-deoxyribonucleotidase